MTAQIADRIEIEGEPYAIVGVKGTGLFDPDALGIACEMRSTGCVRGYYATYASKEGELRFTSLEISLAGWRRMDFAPTISGAGPSDVTGDGHATYEIDAVIPFTGTLLAARGLIVELYEHLGFQPAWKYRNVRELTFREGRLERERDVSAEIAEVRKHLAPKPSSPYR